MRIASLSPVKFRILYVGILSCYWVVGNTLESKTAFTAERLDMMLYSVVQRRVTLKQFTWRVQSFPGM